MFSTGDISLGLARLKDHKGFKVFIRENRMTISDIKSFVMGQLNCDSLQKLADKVNEVFYGMTPPTYRKDMEDEFIANEIYGLLCESLGIDPIYELNYDVY